MFAETVALALGLAASPATPPQAVADRTALLEQCADNDRWNDPAPPTRIFGNVYDVGTCGIVVLLVTSDQGHILIDGATEAAAPGILRNIAALGFRPRDIKVMLNGHEHFDHAGGLAALKRATGARLLARKPSRAGLETGTASAGDPQRGLNVDYPGVKVDALVRDRQVVRVGPLRLTAQATPGHTPGATSWTWRSCEGSVCRSIAYVDSMTALSNDSFRFSDRPAYLAAFRAALDRITRFDCDILITPHPGVSSLYERLAGKGALVDRTACATYAEGARTRLDARIAQERGR